MSNSKLQSRIKSRLTSLREIDGVSVKISKNFGSIDILHKRHHVADFKFKWTDGNHYAGYFVSAGGKKSQAIVSLWSPFDAVKFLVLYSNLVDLCAKRESPSP